MQQELKDEKARLDQDLEEWGKKCEQDITEARKEQEELLKPYHDDLANAEAEHKTLVEERDAINAEISRLQDAIVDHKERSLVTEMILTPRRIEISERMANYWN